MVPEVKNFFQVLDRLLRGKNNFLRLFAFAVREGELNIRKELDTI